MNSYLENEQIELAARLANMKNNPSEHGLKWYLSQLAFVLTLKKKEDEQGF